MRYAGLLSIWVVLAAGLWAEAASKFTLSEVPKTADDYVRVAMEGNLALQRASLDVDRARARLAEVRAAYQPRIDLVARYSMADGGRTIDFPVGDLLNGAYATLNDYLVSAGRPAAFPQVANQSIPLLRDREKETKVRIVQPLFRPEIGRGVQASEAEQTRTEASVAAYRRELREGVLLAYYRWRQAVAAEQILRDAASVTAEALRVNRVLFETGKLTEDHVLRAEAEALAVEQQQAAAARDRSTAGYALNFLMNRPLDAALVEADAGDEERLARGLAGVIPDVMLSAEGREELQVLDAAVGAASAGEAVAAAGRLPTVALAVEGGIQGESYRTGKGANYVQGSVVAEFNVWDGKARQSQREQARLARRAVELQRDEVRLQLALALRRARDDFVAAQVGFLAADRRREATDRAFALVSAREREGQVNQLGFLDARREATTAALQREIALQMLLSSAATLDRAGAITLFP